MKFLLISLVCVFMMSSARSQIGLETTDARVNFNYVKEKTEGTFTGVEATIQLNPFELNAAAIRGVVDVATLNTGNKLRDKHLKSKDYFDAENFPQMVFISDTIYKTGTNYKVEGHLTIKDITKEVVFTIQEKETELKFETTVFAADYDVAIKKDRKKSEVKIVVSVPLK